MEKQVNMEQVRKRMFTDMFPCVMLENNGNHRRNLQNNHTLHHSYGWVCYDAWSSYP